MKSKRAIVSLSRPYAVDSSSFEFSPNIQDRKWDAAARSQSLHHLLHLGDLANSSLNFWKNRLLLLSFIWECELKTRFFQSYLLFRDKSSWEKLVKSISSSAQSIKGKPSLWTLSLFKVSWQTNRGIHRHNKRTNWYRCSSHEPKWRESSQLEAAYHYQRSYTKCQINRTNTPSTIVIHSRNEQQAYELYVNDTEWNYTTPGSNTIPSRARATSRKTGTTVWDGDGPRSSSSNARLTLLNIGTNASVYASRNISQICLSKSDIQRKSLALGFSDFKFRGSLHLEPIVLPGTHQSISAYK